MVLGGAYRESVVEPESDNLVGSGLRAAASLTEVTVPSLVTASDESVHEEIELIAGALNIDLTTVTRTEPVKFHYMTPLSSPTITGPNSILQADIAGQDDVVLAFGMIEAAPGAVHGVSIDAELVVLDPQKPRDTDALNLNSVSSARTVLVANTSETLGLARKGRNLSVPEAASILLTDLSLEAVVTKQGAMGSVVSWRDGGEIKHERVGVHPTRRVWPIGSGDTFSAGISFALGQGAGVLEAAAVGSAAAASWCSTQSFATPASILNGSGGDLPTLMPGARPKIYLAGPFFTIAERWLIEEMRNALYGLGVDVWSPLHEVGAGGLEVAQKDLDGLQECDAVLALLDNADPGTVFEVGWAVREGIPVVGHAKVLDTEVTKMMAGTEVELHRDLSTACYRASWAGLGMRVVPGWMT